MKKFIKKAVDHDVARVRKHPIFWMYASLGAGIYLGLLYAQTRDPHLD